MKFGYLLIAAPLLASCASDAVRNRFDHELRFSAIHSDFQVTDANGYGCGRMDRAALVHVLETGLWISDRELHDHYSTTGCRVTGGISVNSVATEFTFDYGGILRLSNGKVLGCGEACCTEGFDFCSWDRDELKGY